MLDTVARLTATVRKSEADEAEKTALSVVGIDEVPLLDEQTLQRLAALGKGDVNFLQTVVHGYIAETEKLLDAMHTALGKREFTPFKELAHTLKGSSGNVGALALHQLSRKMMQLDRAEFDHSAGELLSQASGSFKSTKMMLFRYLNESDRASL